MEKTRREREREREGMNRENLSRGVGSERREIEAIKGGLRAGVKVRTQERFAASRLSGARRDRSRLPAIP